MHTRNRTLARRAKRNHGLRKIIAVLNSLIPALQGACHTLACVILERDLKSPCESQVVKSRDQIVRAYGFCRGANLSDSGPCTAKSATPPRPPVLLQLPGASSEAGIIGARAQSPPRSAELSHHPQGPKAHRVPASTAALAPGSKPALSPL